jgi:pSer/pThr/pTyr-binding forkhead associated (FHA) protein
MRFDNWVLPWRKKKGETQERVKNTVHDTKVFALKRDGRASLPSMALVVIKGPDCGREFLLTPMTIKIGRGTPSHIRLTDSNVSRDHAVLQYHPKKRTFLLKDVGSTNGTFYNNQRINSIFIAPEAEIRLGESILKVLALSKENLSGEEKRSQGSADQK